MSQPDAAETAVERLKKEIAKERERLLLAMQKSESPAPAEERCVGRLYRVFEAMGQAS